MKRLSIILVTLFCCFGHSQDKASTFVDEEDGNVDLSKWLSKKAGFLGYPSLITEPALGYGAGINLYYFHTSLEEKKGPPSVSGLLGGYTESKSWYAGAFHLGFWKNDKLRYLGALLKTDFNLDYYGTNIQLKNPLKFNIDAWLLLQKLTSRIKESPFFIGGQYLFLTANNSFSLPVDLPEFNGLKFSSTLSELGFVGVFDTRDNVFSPDEGWYLDATIAYSADWLGSDSNYSRINFDARWHQQLTSKWLASMRLLTKHSSESIPFWVTPYIDLRGVPAIKYQNRQASSIEAQIDFRIDRRWSLDAFTGYGIAYEEFKSFDLGTDVINYGGGFRYLIARQLGVRAGLDFAWTNDNDFAFYFVLGQAW